MRYKQEEDDRYGARPLRLTVRAAAIALVLAGAFAGATVRRAAAPDATMQRPRITLRTGLGTIVIELDPEAAPAAVKQLCRMVAGPLYNPAVLPVPAAAAGIGYLDGLAFDYTHAHVEIRTAIRQPVSPWLLTTELDAEALGLHEQRISSPAEAMAVMQHELLAHAANHRDQLAGSSRLAGWLRQWSQSFRADFLIGVSHKELNEALGYCYRRGLASRPVTPGAVMLEPASPCTALPRLCLALTGLPQRNGRWMVVGQVVAGLAVAEQISVGPLQAGGPKSFQPRSPVVISSATLAAPSPDRPEGAGLTTLRQRNATMRLGC